VLIQDLRLDHVKAEVLPAFLLPLLPQFPLLGPLSLVLVLARLFLGLLLFLAEVDVLGAPLLLSLNLFLVVSLDLLFDQPKPLFLEGLLFFFAGFFGLLFLHGFLGLLEEVLCQIAELAFQSVLGERNFYTGLRGLFHWWRWNWFGREWLLGGLTRQLCRPWPECLLQHSLFLWLLDVFFFHCHDLLGRWLFDLDAAGPLLILARPRRRLVLGRRL